MFDLIIIWLVLSIVASPADAKGRGIPKVYAISPRIVNEELAAKALAHNEGPVYECQRVELKVKARVVRVPKK